MVERYEKAVAEQLIDSFGEVTNDDFGDVLLQCTQNLIMDNLDSYYFQLIDRMEGSLLEELDEEERLTVFHELMDHSVAYMLMNRCGVDPTVYFDPSDFFDIVNFNTPSTWNVIGTASSDLSEMLLREVSQTIRTFAQRENLRYDEEKQPERSDSHERDHIHETGRLPHPEPHITDAARTSAWEIRTDAPTILAGTQESHVHDTADELHIDPTPVRDRADSPGSAKSDRDEVGTGAGRDRAAENAKSDAVDTADEQLSAAGRGNNSDGADLQLTIFPTEAQQRQAIEADDFIEIDETTAVLRELEQIGLTSGVILDIDNQGNLTVTPKEFQPIKWINGQFLPEQDINLIFRAGSGFADGILRIQTLYEQQLSVDERVKYLKDEYGIGGRSWTFSNGSRGFIHYDSKGFTVESYSEHKQQKFTWKHVEQHIQYLIVADLYLDDKEKDIYNEFQSSHNNSILLPEPAHVFEPVSLSEPEKTEKQLPAGNYYINHKQFPPATPKERFGRNIAAIRMLQQLQQEERKPTVQEQRILFAYCGWGSLPMAFDPDNKPWAEEYKTLKNLLPDDQYAAARASTLTVFYTPTQIIQAMYTILDHLGFKGGNILEPSCGIGNFFGLLPEEMKNSSLYGIELDSLTGQIAQMLYPDAHISIQGFEENKMPDNYFDVVIGNVPFGDFKVDDPRFSII